MLLMTLLTATPPIKAPASPDCAGALMVVAAGIGMPRTDKHILFHMSFLPKHLSLIITPEVDRQLTKPVYLCHRQS
jgi:hypothetical protein